MLNFIQFANDTKKAEAVIASVKTAAQMVGAIKYYYLIKNKYQDFRHHKDVDLVITDLKNQVILKLDKFPN